MNIYENIYSLSDNLIRQKIGKKLKAVRLRQDITQAKLAADSQVSLSSIKKLEKGEIASFDTLLRVLRVLGKLDALQPLIEEEQMSPNEYYEFVNKARKKQRKRASKSQDINNQYVAAEPAPEW